MASLLKWKFLPQNCIYRYRAQYNKKTRQWTAVPILKPKTYEYIPELMELICAKSRNVQGPIDQPLGFAPTDQRNIAPSRFATPRPDMRELLKSHKFRFK